MTAPKLLVILFVTQQEPLAWPMLESATYAQHLQMITGKNNGCQLSDHVWTIPSLEFSFILVLIASIALGCFKNTVFETYSDFSSCC